jgi:endoglucanase
VEEPKTEAVDEGESKETMKEQDKKTEKKASKSTFGPLAVKGTDLVDAKGNKVQLKGVSSHGLQWYPEYINKETLQELRDDWGANVIRLAMYTNEGGYCSGADREQLKQVIDDGVNISNDLGMYCIIDWHILSDCHPVQYQDEAKNFFDEMSKKYASYDNVLYEICNEPNNGANWDEIKSYADAVIPVIRANDPDAIILVGTPNWSQDVDVVAANPVDDPTNVMYVCHFYAATHKDDLRNKVKKAISAGTPVFISEFSICDASGNGALDYDSASKWMDLAKEYNLSYVGWNLSNKPESSAVLVPSCTKTSGWSESDLNESGKWLRRQLRGEQ